MTGPTRINPKLPVDAMQTYAIRAPKQTHSRPASCAEADCPNLRHGWRSVIDETSDLGAAQAGYIRRESGRKFTEARDEAGLTVFTFEPWQRCFAQHTVSLDREPFYIVRGGDWRGNPRGEIRRHVRADDWVEDFAQHQTTLADRLEQG